nr:molybdopterin dinucleotide binding domain-containing protein [Deinococcus sp. JMULE3]
MRRDLTRLHATLGAPVAPLVLIGRRQLRSNNSWMHNTPRLMRGPDRCTLHLNPADAQGLTDGQLAQVTSRVGTVTVPVEITDAVMPGVASLPHGFGHARPGVQLGVAQASPGVSLNDLTDPLLLDELTGNAVLNGTPIRVQPATQAAGSQDAGSAAD